jgi:hypothetical protein
MDHSGDHFVSAAQDANGHSDGRQLVHEIVRAVDKTLCFSGQKIQKWLRSERNESDNAASKWRSSKGALEGVTFAVVVAATGGQQVVSSCTVSVSAPLLLFF